jgi:hypothetical protein
LQLINLDVDFIIANPMRFLEILAENENIVNMLTINFLIVDEYIQFRKMQTMDYVKKLVEKLRVKKIFLDISNYNLKILNIKVR